MKFVWDDNKIKILTELYAYSEWSEIFNHLGFDSKTAIQAKASKLGLKRLLRKEKDTTKYQRKIYTQEDFDFIVNNYNKMKTTEIAEKLNCSINSIHNQVKKLNVKKEHWTEEDIILLKEVYPHYSNKYLSDFYFTNKEPSTIRRMGLKYNLHKSDKKGLKWFDEKLMIAELNLIGKKLNRAPYHYELSGYNLPSSKTYASYFGSYIKACIKAELVPNTFCFGKSYSSVASDGSFCASKAERFITEFLISNDVIFTKEPNYKDYIDDDRCGMKRFDWKIENYFIEYFGMPEKEYYKVKMEDKIKICEDNGIKLICLYKKDLKNLKEKLHLFLKHESVETIHLCSDI